MTEAVAQPPRVNRSVDIKKLPLRPEEAFVFSRVDGLTSPKDIALTTGMSTAQVEQALDRLAELGALDGWRVRREPSVSGTLPRPNATQQPPSGKRSAPPPSVDDGFVAVPDLDISASEQHRVWKLWKRLGTNNYYELLGLPRSATRDQVKAAYFEQVAAFHPDKHFGKTLGTYKEKLEAVFQRLTQAHDTLSRTRRREEYDATLPPASIRDEVTPTAATQAQPSVRPSAKPSGRPSDRPKKSSRPAPSQRASSTSQAVAPRSPTDLTQVAVEEKTSTKVPRFKSSVGEMKAPVAEVKSSNSSTGIPATSTSSSPVTAKTKPGAAGDGSLPPVSVDQRRQMAIRSLERGMRSMPSGERPAPRPSPSVPSRRSPSNAPPSSRSMMLDRARAAERDGDLEGAAACYEKAAATAKDAALFAKTAECLESIANAGGKDPAVVWKRAADSARQAVQLSPANPQFRLLLSRVYAGAGMRASATREAEKAQELSPSEKSVQSWLERLRRGDV